MGGLPIALRWRPRTVLQPPILVSFLFLPLIVLVALAASLFGPLFDPRRTKSQQERSVSIRLTLFSWMLGALLILALIFSPNKVRVLMMAPVLVVAIGIGRVWKSARERARLAEKVNLEEMKRARPVVKAP